MWTPFYERTAYHLSDEPVPNCFVKLDEHFAAREPTGPNPPLHFGLVLAESVCARMADVEMYAYLMEDARKRHSLELSEVSRDADTKAAVLSHSFLIGYLGACRALLDSAAVTLGTLYELPLPVSECRFNNGDFWHQFVVCDPNAHRRYHPLRLFFNEILQWSDESAVRVPPLVLTEHHYGQFSRRETLLRVLDEPKLNVEAMAEDVFSLTWIDPLDLNRRWKPKLLSLCEKLCVDIQENF